MDSAIPAIELTPNAEISGAWQYRNGFGTLKCRECDINIMPKDESRDLCPRCGCDGESEPSDERAFFGKSFSTVGTTASTKGDPDFSGTSYGSQSKGFDEPEVDFEARERKVTIYTGWLAALILLNWFLPGDLALLAIGFGLVWLVAVPWLSILLVRLGRGWTRFFGWFSLGLFSLQLLASVVLILLVPFLGQQGLL